MRRYGLHDDEWDRIDVVGHEQGGLIPEIPTQHHLQP